MHDLHILPQCKHNETNNQIAVDYNTDFFFCFITCAFKIGRDARQVVVVVVVGLLALMLTFF